MLLFILLCFTIQSAYLMNVLESCENIKFEENCEINEHYFKKILPPDYLKYERPGNKNKATIVEHSLGLNSVSNFDIRTMEITLNMWHIMRWEERRLIDPPGHGVNDSYYLDTDMLKYIWTPHSNYFPMKQVSVFIVRKPNVIVRRIGYKIMLEVEVSLTLVCPANLKAYPMDTQYCPLSIESLQYSSQISNVWHNRKAAFDKRVNDQLPEYQFSIRTSERFNISFEGRLHPSNEVLNFWYEGRTDFDMKLADQLPEYKFRSIYEKPYNFTYIDEGSWSALTLTLVFERKLQGHIFHFFIPTSIFVLMAWMSFRIPCHLIQPRWFLTITSMLTLATQIASIRSSLPPMSSVRAVDVWSLACFLAVFIILIIQSVLTTLYHKAEEMEKEINQINMNNSNFNNHQKAGGKCNFDSQAERNITVKFSKMRNLNNKLQFLSQVVLMAGFIIFVIIYWVYYTQISTEIK